jgi:hypothetical protein
LIDLLLETLSKRSHPARRSKAADAVWAPDCRHTWTYRSTRNPTAKYQDDYLFASRALADRLEECDAPDFMDDWPSDHVPVVAAFR